MKEETLGRQLTLEANRTILIIRSGRIYSLDIDGIGNGQPTTMHFGQELKEDMLPKHAVKSFSFLHFEIHTFKY